MTEDAHSMANKLGQAILNSDRSIQLMVTDEKIDCPIYAEGIDKDH